MKVVKINNDLYFYDNDVLPAEFADIAASADEIPEQPSRDHQLDIVDGKLVWALIDPELTAAERREKAYNTEKIIEWESDMLTVTDAATLWYYYAAEGSDKASELQVLIAEAKAKIREMYPEDAE